MWTGLSSDSVLLSMRVLEGRSTVPRTLERILSELKV